MTTVLLSQILDAIETTLAAASISGYVHHSYDELQEGIPDTPTLQIYPERGVQDVTGNADRSGFQGGVRQTEFTIHADYYAAQRSHIGEDMANLVNGVDALIAVLEQQDTKAYFGLTGIKAFHWDFTRVTFRYAEVDYVGVRFILTVRVF